MNNLKPLFDTYLEYCVQQKRLDSKTLKAYRIDLNQFMKYSSSTSSNDITPNCLERYISMLHQNFKPKTVKRKIASLKAFIHYLEFKDIIDKNPFNKVQIKFREPNVLPRTIPLHIIELTFYSSIIPFILNLTLFHQLVLLTTLLHLFLLQYNLSPDTSRIFQQTP